jgi:3-hydroxyacyl-[acyl-carrier-protein] dehydratase
MLQHNLFYFTELQTEDDLLRTNIELNAEHPIFKGHFPGQPILPGVCILQMVKEITEHHAKRSLKLVKADDLKFLSFVDPDQNKLIRMELRINFEDEQIKVVAQLLENATLLFKFKGIFAPK